MLCAWVMLHAWLLAPDGERVSLTDASALAALMSLEVWTGLRVSG